MTKTHTITDFEKWLMDYPPYREHRADIYTSITRIWGMLQALEKQPGLTDKDQALIRKTLLRWHEVSVEITKV
jgi:hypothetical protein